MDSQRRIFLHSAARIVSLAAAGTMLSGSSASAATRLNGTAYPFALGVASGSPLPDAVVLLTRICYDQLQAAATPAIALNVRWEVAEDEAFRRIAAKGQATATPALAHSVHVDAGGLAPGRWYWYRFMLGDAVSPVGRTRTAPAADALPASLKLAVASCQHWEFGAYAAHRHIAAAAPDLVAFLGDYIYDTRELMIMDMQLRMPYIMDIDIQTCPQPWPISNSSSTRPFVKSSKTATSDGYMTN